MDDAAAGAGPEAQDEVGWTASTHPRPKVLEIAPDIASEAARIREGLQRSISGGAPDPVPSALPANPADQEYASYAAATADEDAPPPSELAAGEDAEPHAPDPAEFPPPEAEVKKAMETEALPDVPLTPRSTQPSVTWSPPPTSRDLGGPRMGVSGLVLIAGMGLVGVWLLTQKGGWDQAMASLHHGFQSVGLPWPF